MGVGLQISDEMLHPQTASALRHSMKVPWATFRKTFPLYMSISLVPYVVSPALPHLLCGEPCPPPLAYRCITATTVCIVCW